MTRATALLLLGLAAIALIAAAEHGPVIGGDNPLLIQAHACQPLPNPCDTIDCKRVDTRRIT